MVRQVGDGHLAKYLVIAGPTASGKSALGLELATRLNGEIISCDSVQVYRGFDIGAAKPTPEEQASVPHHLLDVVDPLESFDAADYAVLAKKAIADVHSRHKVTVVVGGTGFYLRALWGQAWDQNLPSDAQVRQQFVEMSKEDLYRLLSEKDPERARAIHPNDHFRLARAMELVTLIGGPLSSVGFGQETQLRDPEAFVVILDPPRVELHDRIAMRTRQMLAGGLIDEVRSLLDRGIPPTAKPMQSIGYREVCAFLAGDLEESNLESAIIAATRQYAKRQTTWFRRVPADLRLSDPDLAKILSCLNWST
jgi:tRNA dimethylallyltransferase